MAEAFQYAEPAMMMITTMLPAGFNDWPPEGPVVWVTHGSCHVVLGIVIISIIIATAEATVAAYCLPGWMLGAVATSSYRTLPITLRGSGIDKFSPCYGCGIRGLATLPGPSVGPVRLCHPSPPT